MKRERTRKGAAVVELAIVLPLFLLIALGTIESCSMMYLSQNLHIAAYEGARASLVPKSITSDVTTAANRILTSRQVKSASIVISPSDFSSLEIGQNIQVTVSAPSDANSPILGMFFIGRTMSASCSMMKEY
jgi:Flp pilus assembly protein TadG